MFRDVVFLNEDGTVFNILNVRSLEVIQDMPDYANKTWFDYTDWEVKPGPQSTYNSETQEWAHYNPTQHMAPEDLPRLHPIETSAEATDVPSASDAAVGEE